MIPLLYSCFVDKGNYDYTELPEIKIEGIPAQIDVLSFADRIIASPKITSSTEGEITNNNSNYTFRYRLGQKGMGSMGITNGLSNTWLELNPNGEKNLDVPANYNAGTYLCWFTVTDKRNNVVNSYFFDVKVSTTTYEGWLVLCDYGAEEKVRLDMISVLTSTNIKVITDVASGLPVLHHATQVGFHPTSANPGDRVYIFSKEGSYLLDNGTLESNSLQEFNLNNFVTMPGGGTEKITYFTSMSRTSDPSYMLRYSFAFSDAGNVYCKDYSSGGAVFEFPINTPLAAATPQYKVAPFAGFSEVRPANGTKALFYDTTNKRFVGFINTNSRILSPINDPQTGKLFSFQTGKNMVYMEGTRRSNGLVYAILEDSNGRSIYAINMGGNGFVQEAYYENVNAPGFNQAKYFAFHSQYPLMFYSDGKKVYQYNLGTNIANEVSTISVGSSEEVTKLKFNLYKKSRLTDLNKQTDEFMNQQYQLIVATFNNSASGSNNGKVAFYNIDGSANSVTKNVEYSGFAKVRDIVYRER